MKINEKRFIFKKYSSSELAYYFKMLKHGKEDFPDFKHVKERLPQKYILDIEHYNKSICRNFFHSVFLITSKIIKK